jgi:hypothetical protein
MITDPEVFKAFGDVVSRVEQLSGTVETFTSLYSTISEAQTEEYVTKSPFQHDITLTDSQGYECDGDCQRSQQSRR